MNEFPELIRRHQVDPGPLVHVGAAQRHEIPAYYEAGFSDITVIDSAPERVKSLRTRFPGVFIVEMTGNETLRLDARARVVTVNVPGHELAVLDALPWDNLTLLTVATTAKDGADAASSYDLVTEAVTTRGFVEVDRWTRHPHDAADVNVVYLRP